MKPLNDDTVNAIGVWVLRLALVGAVCALALIGKDDAAAGAGFALLFTFFFL